MKEQMLNFLKLNVRWLLIGLFLLILGYVILGWDGGGKSYEASVFSWHKMTLAPIILLAGYIVIGYSIMHQSKK